MSKSEELAKLTSDFYTKGPTLLKEALIELMEEKGWNGIFVNGWAPYFNDGDACEFGIHSCGPIVGDVDDCDDNWNNEIGDLLDKTLIELLFDGEEGCLTLYKTGKVDIEYVEHP